MFHFQDAWARSLGAPQWVTEQLGGAIFRLLKFSRESCPTPGAHGYAGTCAKLVAQLHGDTLVVFDVSFRDDLRSLCAWAKLSILLLDQVREWANRLTREPY